MGLPGGPARRVNGVPEETANLAILCLSPPQRLYFSRRTRYRLTAALAVKIFEHFEQTFEQKKNVDLSIDAF